MTCASFFRAARETAALEAFLQAISERGAEDLIQDVIRRFEAAKSDTIHASMLPHYDVVKDFYHAELHALQLSPDGDIIMYLPQLGYVVAGVEGPQLRRRVLHLRALRKI